MPSFDYDITSVPYSQTVPQATFNASNQVIFRFTSAVKTMLGFRANSGGTFAPRQSVLANDGTTVLQAAQSGTGGHHYFMLTPDTFYIKVTRNGGGASDFDFTFNFDTFALDDFTVEVGDILINDDANRPATLLAADGTLKSYVSAVPGGEVGAILPNGISAWYDAFGKYHATNRIALIDATLQYITSVSVGSTLEPNICADGTKFWVVNDDDELWTVTADGVATNTGYVFPTISFGVELWTCGVNRAGTILYWAVKDDDGVIHALDLDTLTALPDLYAIPGFSAPPNKIATTFGGHQGDLIVLDDGTVVTWWDDGLNNFHVLHLDTDGTVLQDVSFTDPDLVNHLAVIYGQSADVLLWKFTDFSAAGRIGNLTLSTGTLSDDFAQTFFSSGFNLESEPEMFGPSTSCTIVRFSLIDDDGSDDVLDGTIGPIVWAEVQIRIP